MKQSVWYFDAPVSNSGRLRALLLEAAQRRMSGADQLVEEEKLNSVDIVTKTDEGELYCFGL